MRAWEQGGTIHSFFRACLGRLSEVGISGLSRGIPTCRPERLAPSTRLTVVQMYLRYQVQPSDNQKTKHVSMGFCYETGVGGALNGSLGSTHPF